MSGQLSLAPSTVIYFIANRATPSCFHAWIECVAALLSFFSDKSQSWVTASRFSVFILSCSIVLSLPVYYQVSTAPATSLIQAVEKGERGPKRAEESLVQEHGLLRTIHSTP